MFFCLRKNDVIVLADQASLSRWQFTRVNKSVGVPVLYVYKEKLWVESNRQSCHGTKIARNDLT